MHSLYGFSCISVCESDEYEDSYLLRVLYFLLKYKHDRCTFRISYLYAHTNSINKCSYKGKLQGRKAIQYLYRVAFQFNNYYVLKKQKIIVRLSVSVYYRFYYQVPLL